MFGVVIVYNMISYMSLNVFKYLNVQDFEALHVSSYSDKLIRTNMVRWGQ